MVGRTRGKAGRGYIDSSWMKQQIRAGQRSGMLEIKGITVRNRELSTAGRGTTTLQKVTPVSTGTMTLRSGKHKNSIRNNIDTITETNSEQIIEGRISATSINEKVDNEKNTNNTSHYQSYQKDNKKSTVKLEAI